MRKIVIHHHIFKNAGVSIDHNLSSNFDGSWLAVEGPNPFSSLSNQDLIRFLDTHTTCKSVSSHQARVIRNEIDGYKFFPVIFLRDPVDRIGSCYQYEKLVNTNYHSSIAAQRGLKYYVQYCLGEEGIPRSNVISNYQTLHLSDAFNNVEDTRNIVASDDLFNQSVNYLNSLPCLGIVDNFLESQKFFEKWLVPHFPGINFINLKLNSSKRADLKSERVNLMRQEMGDKIYELLLERNSYDLRLYKIACQKFHKLRSFYEHEFFDIGRCIS